jgi:hypothetical protein
MSTALGDLEEGFKLYEGSYQRHSCWLIFTRVEPSWDSLREDPRYLALRRKLP